MLFSPQLIVPPARRIIAAAAGGNVLFDASAFSSVTSAVSGASLAPSLAMNVGSGVNGTANLVLIMSVSFVNGSAAAASPSVTWNGVSMTQIGTFADITGGASGSVYLFGLVNPALGAQVTVVSWTGVNQIAVGAASFVGADQTGGTTTFRNATTATGSGTPNSVTVSSATGEKVFSGHVVAANFSTGSGTDVGHNNTGNICSGAANWDVGAASVSNTYSFTGGTGWGSNGCSIKAA